jgi:hypothetical protein
MFQRGHQKKRANSVVRVGCRVSISIPLMNPRPFAGVPQRSKGTPGVNGRPGEGQKLRQNTALTSLISV